MATMNRNPNLEEINTDAFMGITFLSHQTFGQKIFFFGGVILGIGLNVICNYVLQMNMMVSILMTLVPIMIGIAYGCNYNEDLTLMQYLKLILFRPSKAYYSKSTEDVVYLRAAEDRIRMEELRQEMLEQQSPEARRKVLVKLIVGIVVGIILFVVLLIVVMSTKTNEIHHVATVINSMKSWEMNV